jgi:putative MATE family efflux protein
MRIRKDVLDLSLPIIAEQTFIMVMGVVNAIMAGHLGKEAVSAIGMVDSINNIFIAFFSALAIGVTVVIAQYAGKRNYQKANDAALHGMISSILISLAITLLIYIFRAGLIRLLFGNAEQSVLDNSIMYLNITLLTYPLISATSIASGILRGAGDTRTPMKVSIIMNILNVLLSYSLIYGLKISNSHFNLGIPALGVKGAALGIAAARAAGALLVLYILISGSKAVKLSIEKDMKVNFELLRSIYSVGLPASVESLLFNFGRLITQVFIVGLGTASIAGNYVASSAFGLINIPGNSLSLAATTMVGQRMGQGDSDGAREDMLYLVKLTSISLLAICAAAFPTAKVLSALYTSDTEVINISADLIRSMIFAMPFFWALSFILPAGLKGAGDGKYTMVAAIFSMWVFRIGAGYILCIPAGFGVLGVWIGMYVDWVVRSILFFVRLKKGKWRNNVVIRS